jgi:hypothetical protein
MTPNQNVQDNDPDRNLGMTFTSSSRSMGSMRPTPPPSPLEMSPPIREGAGVPNQEERVCAAVVEGGEPGGGEAVIEVG